MTVFGCIGWISLAIALATFIVYALTTITGLLFTSLGYAAAGLITLIISAVLSRLRKGAGETNHDKQPRAQKQHERRKRRRRVRRRREDPLLHEVSPPPQASDS